MFNSLDAVLGMELPQQPPKDNGSDGILSAGTAIRPVSPWNPYRVSGMQSNPLNYYAPAAGPTHFDQMSVGTSQADGTLFSDIEDPENCGLKEVNTVSA